VITGRLPRLLGCLGRLEGLTRPVSDDTRVALEWRSSELPEQVRSDGQTLGRTAIGCEATHGVFPRCNFTCTPCYHSADANRCARYSSGVSPLMESTSLVERFFAARLADGTMPQPYRCAV
jgi:hypothetical protein